MTTRSSRTIKASPDKSHGKVVHVEVTQAAIDRAFRNNSSKCVVATAIAQAIPDAKRIDVDMQTIRWTTFDGERCVFLTPHRVQQYIVDFDAGAEIEPFKFRLYLDKKLTLRRVVSDRPAKTVEAARQNLSRTKKSAAGVISSPHKSRAEKAVAKEKLAKAEQRYEQAKIAHPDAKPKRQPKTKPTDRVKVPTVKKTRQRHYGWREMRINQARVSDDAAERKLGEEAEQAMGLTPVKKTRTPRKAGA